MEMFNPPHPGLLIRDQMGSMTVTDLAKHLQVTRASLSRLIHGRCALTAEMALRLQDAFGIKAAFWLEMQFARDLWTARQKQRIPIPSVVRQSAMDQDLDEAA